MVAPKVLVEGQALSAASAALYYTAPANITTIIKKVTFANSDGGAARLVTAYIVPSGQGAGPSNIIVDARNVGPIQTYEAFEMENHVLAPGDSIWALCDANPVSIRVSGIEISGS